MSENKNINETEEKIVSLDEFLNICIKFLNSEITKEDLKEWLDNNLYIKRYLPLLYELFNRKSFLLCKQSKIHLQYIYYSN